MSRSFKDYIEAFNALSLKKSSFVTVTLTNVKGSAPQDLGAKMIVSKSGIEYGTIGGGKLEAHAIGITSEIIKSCNDKTISSVINLQRDIGMTCGGEVSLLFEPHFEISSWNIVIFGAGHISQALTRTLLKLNCSLTVIDSRIDWLDKLPNDSYLNSLVMDTMEDAVESLKDSDFVVVMTMGHQTDLPILKAALLKDFSYLGAIGSDQKKNRIVSDLIESGIPKKKIDTLLCPIGESFGSNDPEEIALSIVVQLIKRRDS